MDLIISIIVFSALVFASISDIKTREVPDWLNYSLITLGLGFNIITSIISGTITPIINSIIGLIIGLIIGYLMFYTGQWGGGDAKLMMGIGAFFGLNPLASWNPMALQEFIIFLINLVFAGAIYGFTWITIMIIKNWKKFYNSFVKKTREKKIIRIRLINLGVISTLIIIIAIINNTIIRISLLGIALLLFIMVYAIIIAKTVEEVCMIKKIPVSKLTEGDWVAEEIKIKGKLIAGPENKGITREQIMLLKKNNIKKVVVKEGIPFIPSFLLAFITYYFLGNWFLLLI